MSKYVPKVNGRKYYTIHMLIKHNICIAESNDITTYLLNSFHSQIQEFICDLTSIWEKVSKSKSEREEINSSTKGQHKTKTNSNTKR